MSGLGHGIFLLVWETLTANGPEQHEKEAGLRTHRMTDREVLQAIEMATQQHFANVISRLDRIEEAVTLLGHEQTVKEWYSTAEAAQKLGRSKFTVREWCRLGRINSRKQRSGRGAFLAWSISHSEVLRIQAEGLLEQRNGR